MSEHFNSFDNDRDDRETAQIHEHLHRMKTDNLIDEMTEIWDSMDEDNFNPQLIDTYLNALSEMEPVVNSLDTEATLSAFHEKHAYLFKNIDSAAMTSEKSPKPIVRRRWHALRLIAAIIAVMLGCMITAQALGVDVFGTIARWTEDTFHFSSSTNQNIEDVNESPINEFSTLLQILDANGIPKTVIPSDYPDGFQMIDVQISETVDSLQIRTAYESGERFFSLTIWQFDSVYAADSHIFEKDSSDVTVYEYAGIRHYIMSNNERTRVAWTNENTMCSISGDLTETEIENMIASIYERN